MVPLFSEIVLYTSLLLINYRITGDALKFSNYSFYPIDILRYILYYIIVERY